MNQYYYKVKTKNNYWYCTASSKTFYGGYCRLFRAISYPMNNNNLEKLFISAATKEEYLTKNYDIRSTVQENNIIF